MDYKVSGHSSSTEVENREHEVSLYARRVVQLPSNQKLRISYDASDREQYVGSAPKGLAEDAKGWIIHKLTYDGTSTRVTERNTAYGTWQDRASYSYD